MTIGFFDTGLAFIPLIKQVAQSFSSHSFVLYADTLNAPYTNVSDVELTTYITQALHYLKDHNCTVLVVSETIPIYFVQKGIERMGAELLVIDSDSLEAYLAQFKETEVSATPEQSPTRLIHLTKHSSESDAQISHLLEGHFIEE